MMKKLVIASVMVCRPPNYLGGRLILSGCDSVWKAVETLPDEIKNYFSDDIGNESVEYGGHLQILDASVLALLDKYDLFACFRCIQEEDFKYAQTVPPAKIYENLIDNLCFMGWDIATGNGWLSASCHGCFPIDPFTGNALDMYSEKINQYGLFSDFDDCKKYCQINNEQIPEHSPWFPLAIYVDQSSGDRLNHLLRC